MGKDDLVVEEGPAVKPPDDGLQYVPPPDAPRGPVLGKVIAQAQPGKVFNVGDDEIAASALANDKAADAK